ncbi:hypothetical protein [Streptomyces sp. Qhu_M48]|uniref:hypothetical protein n=1 Tax=Streptomyces sp. Qhu_M48 TaxID=3435889 RepID=UPI003F5040CA
MTTTSSEFEPVPILVLMLAGDQEVVGRLHARRQPPDGWVNLVSIPAYRNVEDGGVEPAGYRMGFGPQDHPLPPSGSRRALPRWRAHGADGAFLRDP